MPHNTSISEFERQKQDRIAIVKDLIRSSYFWASFTVQKEESEKVLSKLVKSILIEIDKV
mgnify:FL=1